MHKKQIFFFNGNFIIISSSAHIWTEISAGTEILNIAGTETEMSVPGSISPGTGTEPIFGRSLQSTIISRRIF